MIFRAGLAAARAHRAKPGSQPALQWLGAAMLLLVVSACSRSGTAPMQMPPVPVLAAVAVERTVPNQLHQIGTVEAFATVNIKSRVEGELVTIPFEEGDMVKQGQLLFSLDPRPYQAALQQAEANEAKDKAQLVLAEADEERDLLLLRSNVLSREQYDQVHATAAALRATLIGDRAAIETARLNLAYSQIRSPIDGRTGNLQNHIGDMIKADADNPMVTITQVQPIYVDFALPEAELAAVRASMATHQLEVDAAIPNSQEAPEHGMLAFVDNTVNTTTGTILLKGLFQNENRRLWPGEFVNATLTLNDIAHAVVIPSQAIQTGQHGSFVFVVDHQMRVAARPVVTGAELGNETVIEHGIEPGERVVTDGQLRLAPGATVIIKTSL